MLFEIKMRSDILNHLSRSRQESKSRLVAFGSLIVAVLASSCCIGPLLLVTLGVSGAWIGNLTALEAYQPIFLLITIVLVAIGFWQVYFNPKQKCSDEMACTRPISNHMVKAILWAATVVMFLTMTIEYWAPLFY